MAEKREKKIIFTTAAGNTKYPRLTTPDTKFKPEGEYKVTLLLGGVDAEKLTKQIDAAMSASFDAAKKDPANKAKKIKVADTPYKADLDDAGEPTGLTAFNFKMRASGKTKEGKEWSRRPGLFDAKGLPIVGAPKIAGGSIMKVAYSLGGFFTPLVGAGVSLRLEGVQILKLVEWQSGTAASYGFKAEQGEEEETNAAGSTAGADSAANDESDLPF